MQGCGFQAEAEQPHPLVRACYTNDRWAVAKDPIHDLWNAADAVHHDLFAQRTGGMKRVPDRVFGAGPGVSFGKALLEATGVPQGLIACAHGGTSMSQWDPELKPRGGASLYGAMMRRIEKNGSAVAGLFWYQGESDANDQNAPLYTDRMVRFVETVRQDTGISDLPVVLVQIARVFGDFSAAAWNSVQDQQRRLPQAIRRLAVVPAIDLPMNDNIHLSAEGQKRLGRRAAQAMSVLRYGARFGRQPIELNGIRFAPSRHAGACDLVVSFRNVQGRLVSSGPPAGFSLVKDGGLYDRIYRIDLVGSRAVCRTLGTEKDVRDCCLHYGWGLTPACTITDEADRSIPVFGPIPLSGAAVER